MLIISPDTFEYLIKIAEEDIYIEGSILKLIDTTNLSREEKEYVSIAREKAKKNSQKNYKQQKAVLKANDELTKSEVKLKETIDSLKIKEIQIEKAKQEAEEQASLAKEAEKLAREAKEIAEQELDIKTKEAKNKWISKMITFFLWFIGFMLVSLVAIYFVHLGAGKDDESFKSLFGTVITLAIGQAFGALGVVIGIDRMKDENSI